MDGSNYRTSKHTMATQVLPSLRINAFTRPSSNSLDEFILGIEVCYLEIFLIFFPIYFNSSGPI